MSPYTLEDFKDALLATAIAVSLAWVAVEWWFAP